MNNTFSEGDLIEATKGERRVLDRVVVITGSPIFRDISYLGEPTMFGLSSIESYKAAGYTLKTIEKAAPALPTEPGVYRSDSGGIWTIEREGGPFKWVGERGIPVNPHNYAPFTRLEAVADTYARIVPQLEEVARCIADSAGIHVGPSTIDVRRARKILADVIKSMKAVTS